MLIHTYKSTDMHREPWHVAAFTAKKETRPDITRWCYQTYGAPGYRANTAEIRWKDAIQYGEIHFSRKQDLEWFLLKWS